MNQIRPTALLAICIFAAGAAYAESNCDNETSQQGLNICSARNARAADAALAAEYSADLKDASDHRALLKAAQQAWSSYRDAQCALETSQFDGGTMQPFALASCRQRFAIERTRTLSEWWHEAINGRGN